MDIRFDGKRALVTGVGKGIGRAIAIKLAALGAKVHGISRTQEDLDSLKQEVPSIEVYNVDIADWEKTRRVVEGIGPIDLLVNNAGVATFVAFLEVKQDDLENVFDINVNGVFNISQVIAKDMVERGQGGAIVNMSSTAGLRVADACSVYCASKAALDMLTKSMAQELGPHKIRVNSVNPGMVITPLTQRTLAATEEFTDYVKSRTPLQKLTDIDDVVNATVFLLSDKASMINGIVMPVEGGWINRV